MTLRHVKKRWNAEVFNNFNPRRYLAQLKNIRRRACQVGERKKCFQINTPLYSIIQKTHRLQMTSPRQMHSFRKTWNRGEKSHVMSNINVFIFLNNPSTFTTLRINTMTRTGFFIYHKVLLVFLRRRRTTWFLFTCPQNFIFNASNINMPSWTAF